MAKIAEPVFEDGPTEVPWFANSADDLEKTFTVKIDGVAQDVSGWAFWGAIVDNRNSLLGLTAIEWDLTEADQGRVRYYLPHTDSAKARGTYWYELDVATPSKRRAFQCGPLHLGFDHAVAP